MGSIRLAERIVVSVVAFASLASPAAAQFPPVVSYEDFDGSQGFIVEGTEYAQFADKLAAIGDVNDDGVDDFASGGKGQHWYPDCYCEPTDGMVHVIFGRSDISGDGLWSVDDLGPGTGLAIPEIGFEDDHGFVSAAGDFNDDGVADFMVGAPSSSASGWQWGGECFVIFGGAHLNLEGQFDVGALDGGNGFTILGDVPLASIGSYMASIGDFNADGVDDIIFGNTAATVYGQPWTGRCYVVYGGTDVGASGALYITDLDSRTGLVINGISTGDSVGIDVSGLGDFNGDGVADIVIGSSTDHPPGEAYVLYGGRVLSPSGAFDLMNLNGDNGFIIRSPSGALGGMDVDGIGDVNADGFDDVAVQVWKSASDYWVDVVFGGPDVATNGLFELATLDGTNGFSVYWKTTDQKRKTSAPTRIGDLNADGIADFAVAITFTRVVFGAVDLGASGSFLLNNLDGRNGFLFDAEGIPQPVRSAAGDINGDGIADLAVGSKYEQHPRTGADFGRVSIIFGRRMGDADLDADVDLADFGAFQRCYGYLVEGDVPDECRPFDFDKDKDVDLADFAEFRAVFEPPARR